jgi:two-component system OmpR family sensor kinase
MNRLWVRLSLAFSVLVLAWVATIALIAVSITHTGVRQYLLFELLQVPGGLVDELAGYYQTRQSWEGVETLLAGAQSTLPMVGPGERLALSLADARGEIVYHSDEENAARRMSRAEQAGALPVRVGGQTVGYLRLELVPADRAESHRRFFLELMSRVLLAVAAIGGLLGVLFSVLVGRGLAAPLNRLAGAARAIGAGDFSRRAELAGSDEVIELARSFNEMAAALEQSETLRRNLLADVAHELRTPLSVLQGNLRAILDDVYALDKAEVARLYDETRLLGRLVNDLHDLAQAEAGQLRLSLQPTDLAGLVQDTVAKFGVVAEEKGVTLSVRVGADLPPVPADSARLAQVLHNLVTNALRHTPAGGRISLSAGREAGQSMLWLAVQDTGEGISPEHLPHLFERFYRADRARSRAAGGTGLGLAIVRAIVEAHGGRVRAESCGVPGRGSTFTVYLPCAVRGTA